MGVLPKRIRGRSLSELGARAFQGLSILREMASTTLCREMTDTELLGELISSGGESRPWPAADGQNGSDATLAIEPIRLRLQTCPVIRSLGFSGEIARIMACRFPEERQ